MPQYSDPYFLTWREALGLSCETFWPRYGVAAGVGARYERSIQGMPRVLLLLVALHRIGRIAEADLDWAAETSGMRNDRLGQDLCDLRARLGLTQTEFWMRFDIAQATGGRYERGRKILPTARRLLRLYLAGRVDDEALAEGRQWLASQVLPDPDAGADDISETDARPDDLYAIRWMTTHLDTEAGYLVTLRRRHQNHTAWFGQHRYGTELRALAAAQRWRDALIAENRPISKREFVAKIRRNNTSGVAGVRRVIRAFTLTSGKPVEYAVWAARPPRCLKVSGRSFRVDKYGEEGARERAIALRRHFEAQVEGFHAPRVPEEFLPGDNKNQN